MLNGFGAQSLYQSDGIGARDAYLDQNARGDQPGTTGTTLAVDGQ